jgi:hypothetical protein
VADLKQVKNEKAKAKFEKKSHGEADFSENGPPSKRIKTSADYPTLLVDITAQNDDSIPPSAADRLVPPSTTSTVSATSIPGNEALHAELSSTYNVTTTSIISSSKIEKKATRLLELLNTYPVTKGEKENLVALYAKANVASKMISVVEIAKREIAERGGKWFQYNAVGELVEERKLKPQGSEKGGKNGVGDASTASEKVGDPQKEEEDENNEADSGSEAFETMKTPFERAIEGKAKIRAVPVMTVYLSRVRIDRLRKAYG